jgi:formiminoglutamase
MGVVQHSPDPNWPPAATLLRESALPGHRAVGLLGAHTYLTSVTPRSKTSTPAAIREALTRFSTWSYSDQCDLAEHLSVVDYGDVESPDGDDAGDRFASAVAKFDDSLSLRIFLGGDNALTWHALRALAGSELPSYGLITLDAHLDMRDGVSNGSPVRQLLDEGLDGRHVVQVGLADFSNSPHYARQASARHVTVISRDEARRTSIEEIAQRALAIAGEGGRRIYVDVDVDAADRAAAPGCPAAAPGGFSADEMRRFVRSMTAHPMVQALDFTEIDVERDSADQRTVRLAAVLVLEALSGVVRREE